MRPHSELKREASCLTSTIAGMISTHYKPATSLSEVCITTVVWTAPTVWSGGVARDSMSGSQESF